MDNKSYGSKFVFKTVLFAGKVNIILSIGQFSFRSIKKQKQKAGIKKFRYYLWGKLSCCEKVKHT